VIGLEVNPVLIAGGLAVPLIGALALAIRRSIRRQECARLRDELVDAARTGELDVADWRVFSLIDWFDQVASTGRTSTPGRHGPSRLHWADSLASSLATSLLPLGTPGGVDSSWPAPPQLEVGSEVRAAAVRYRERHQQRLRYRPRRPPPPRPRIALTGLPRPTNALVPLTGWPRPAFSLPPERENGHDQDDLPNETEWVDVREPGLVVLPSLMEEIFAVAGRGR
jgi:hypothetical protein